MIEVSHNRIESNRVEKYTCKFPFRPGPAVRHSLCDVRRRSGQDGGTGGAVAHRCRGTRLSGTLRRRMWAGNQGSVVVAIEQGWLGSRLDRIG